MDQRNFLSPTELLGDKFQIEIARHNDLIMICQIIPPANFSKEPVIEISAAHNRIARIALNNGLKIAGSITLKCSRYWWWKHFRYCIRDSTNRIGYKRC